MLLRIAVRSVAGRETAIDADLNDTVEKFQAALARSMGVPAALQVLLHKSILDDNQSRIWPGHRLAEYNLRPGDTMLVVRELPPLPSTQAPAIVVPKAACNRKSPCKGGGKQLGGKSAGCGNKSRAARRCGPAGRPRPMPPMPSCPPPGLSAPQQPAAGAFEPPPRAGAAETVAAAPPPSTSIAEASKAPQAPQREEAPRAHGGSVAPPVPPPSSASKEASASAVAAAALAGSQPQQHGPALPRHPGTASAGGTSAAHAARPASGGSAVVAAAEGAGVPATAAGHSAPSPPSSERALAAVALAAAGAAPRLPNGATSLSWSPPTTLPAGTPAAPPPAGLAPGVPRAEASPPSSGRMVAASQGTGSRERLLAQAVVAPPGATAPQPSRIRRSDLQRIGRLGVGAFGVVTLEADRRTGRTFALKAVSKGYLAQLRMEYSVLNEKRILKMVESPFIVRLLATYNGREHVYFLLEAALGGELFTTYERLRLYGSERHARFYVGCVTEALAHLHERHVIYRDLKPENLLLDSRGYCKLTDMGLAKVTHAKTYTLVGTPDYMAPEVILCSGHTKAVDWWMLGVLLFELLAGKAPFEAESTQQVYELVKRGIEQVRFPHECRHRAAELVRLLCKQQPEARMRTPALRQHEWFRGFDWSALRQMRLTPPHAPHVRGPRDLANFRSCEGEDPPVTPYQDTGSGWDIGFEDDAIGGTPVATTRPLATSGSTAAVPSAEEIHSGRAVLMAGSAAEAHFRQQQQLRQATAPTGPPAGRSAAPLWQPPSQSTLTAKGVVAQRTPLSPPGSPVLGGG
mmetsp:Transcript_88279/g.189528  ORF Transcript_88279/g.189528 Transcript_88279/m.189528 type:complete len:803 (+) Transcript_88279:89-2497(+)